MFDKTIPVESLGLHIGPNVGHGLNNPFLERGVGGLQMLAGLSVHALQKRAPPRGLSVPLQPREAERMMRDVLEGQFLSQLLGQLASRY